MARTRGQRAVAAAEGVPPTPPQQLEAPKRQRRSSRKAATAKKPSQTSTGTQSEPLQILQVSGTDVATQTSPSDPGPVSHKHCRLSLDFPRTKTHPSLALELPLDIITTMLASLVDYSNSLELPSRERVTAILNSIKTATDKSNLVAISEAPAATSDDDRASAVLLRRAIAKNASRVTKSPRKGSTRARREGPILELDRLSVPRPERVSRLFDKHGNFCLGSAKKVTQFDEADNTPSSPTSTSSSPESEADFQFDITPIVHHASRNETIDAIAEEHDDAPRPTDANDSKNTTDTGDARSEMEDLGMTSDSTPPQTPQPRSWGFGSILPSAARSVSRYLPLFARTSVATPSNRQPLKRGSATEPRQHVSVTQGRASGTNSGTTSRRVSSSGGALLTKGQSDARQKAKHERRILADALQRERELRAQEKAEADKIQAELQQLRKAQANTTNENVFAAPKMRRARESEKLEKLQKRKRSPSPEVIPNPPGADYGMNEDFFVVSDDDTESNTSILSSSKRRRVSTDNASTTSKGYASDDDMNDVDTTPKASRTSRISTGGFGNRSTPTSAIIGDPYKATPYTGTMFRIPDKAGQSSTPDQTSKSSTISKTRTTVTPPRIYPNTFRVPSPSSSDESDDEEDRNESAEETTPTKSHGHGAAPPTAHSSVSAAQPSLASLNSATRVHSTSVAPSTQPVDTHDQPGAAEHSLRIQRERALKYATKTPSRLNQSSRLSSTSTAPTTPQQNDFASRDITITEDKNYDTETQVLNTTAKALTKDDLRMTDSYYEYVDGKDQAFRLIETDWKQYDTEEVTTLFEAEYAQFLAAEKRPPASTASTALPATPTNPFGVQNDSSVSTPIINDVLEGIDARPQISDEAQRYVDENWTESDSKLAENTFAKEFEDFIQRSAYASSPMAPI